MYASDILTGLGTGSTLVSCTPIAARLSFGARIMAVQRSLMMPTFCGTCSASACKAEAGSSQRMSPDAPLIPESHFILDIMNMLQLQQQPGQGALHALV